MVLLCLIGIYCVLCLIDVKNAVLFMNYEIVQLHKILRNSILLYFLSKSRNVFFFCIKILNFGNFGNFEHFLTWRVSVCVPNLIYRNYLYDIPMIPV